MSTKRAQDYEKHQRLKFIDDQLFWQGEITRRMIQDAFKVSEDTAKRDLKDYRGLAPELHPDVRDNIYRVPLEFEPRMPPKPNAEIYLRSVAGELSDDIPVISGSQSFSEVPVDVTPLIIRRSVDPTVLQSLVRAIRGQQELRIFYASPSSDETKEIWVLPHAFVNDGFRWACRCWRYRTDVEGYWGEIVLDRIEEVAGETRPADQRRIGTDRDWNEFVTIRLAANPRLPALHRQRIEDQHKMVGGVLEVRLRRCQAVYFLKRHQLEEPITLKAPHQGPLHVLNRDEIVRSIPPLMRVPLEVSDDPVQQLMNELKHIHPRLTEQEIIEAGLRTLKDKTNLAHRAQDLPDTGRGQS